MAQKKSPSTLSRFESAAVRTHSAAKAIVDEETAARVAKMKRLRKARMERDASEAAQAAAEPPKAKVARKSASSK